MIQPEGRIGHIRVEGRLAEGGMGAVFVGFDEKLERQVVLKAIRNDRRDARTRARFLVEARLLSRLDHPNICRIHGYLESEQGDFLILELIRGRTLHQALREGIDRAARPAIAGAAARPRRPPGDRAGGGAGRRRGALPGGAAPGLGPPAVPGGAAERPTTISTPASTSPSSRASTP